MPNPLLDRTFLEALFNQRQRKTYARVTSLTLEETPIEALEGRISQGSLNLDGKSSMRRSVSLTFASAPGVELEDNLNWCLNTKIKLEIGLANEINDAYDPVIWFNQGIFVISSFSYSVSTTGYNVSIQAKDKMCMINGDVGGAIYAAVDFGVEDLINTETGEVETVDLQIGDIITESVREYGFEPYHNIIVSDIAKYGLNLLEYRNEQPLYVMINTETCLPEEAIVNQPVYLKDGNSWIEIEDISSPPTGVTITFFSLNSLRTPPEVGYPYSVFKLSLSSDDTYYIYKIEFGQVGGYELTELTYPRDSEDSDSLSVNAGDNVTSVLDKIVQFLGDYEYFYNTDGQFIFRKKPTALNTQWTIDSTYNTVGLGNDYNALAQDPITWNFSGNELVTQYSSSPKINNIKNDFSIWGSRSTEAGEVPIHLRYAIDKKPIFYRSVDMSSNEIEEYVIANPEFANSFEKDNNDNYVDKPSIIYYSSACPSDYYSGYIGDKYLVDWREIIYQMARDYMKLKHFDNFLSKLMNNNTLTLDGDTLTLYPNGKTGYENYYVDIDGFWRQLYKPTAYKDTDRISWTPVLKSELNTSEDIAIKDFWTMTAPESQFESLYTKYFVLRQEQEDPEHLINYIPLLLENADSLDVRLYLGSNYNSSEPTTGNKINIWCSSSKWNPYSHLVQEYTVTDNPYMEANGVALNRPYGTGVYYNNGDSTASETDLILMGRLNDKMGPKGVVTMGVTYPYTAQQFTTFSTDRYNLVIPMISWDVRDQYADPDYSIDTLKGKDAIGDSIPTDEDLCKYNFYTLYKCTVEVEQEEESGGEPPEPTYEDQYYMFESGVWRQEGEAAKFYNRKLVRVKPPTKLGIAYQGDEARGFGHEKSGDYVKRVGFVRTHEGPPAPLSRDSETVIISRVSTVDILETQASDCICRFKIPDNGVSRIIKINYSDRVVDPLAKEIDITNDQVYQNFLYTDWYQDQDPDHRDNNFIWKLKTNNRYQVMPFGGDQSYSHLENFIFYPRVGASINPDNLIESYKQISVNKFSGRVNKDSQDNPKFSTSLIQYYQKSEIFINFNKDPNNNQWNAKILYSPEELNFWFDFLESDKNSQIGQYGADKIMVRAKAESDDNASSIYYRESETIIWIWDNAPEEINRAQEKLIGYIDDQYTIFRAPYNMRSSFVNSSATKSCKDVLDEWLQNYTYANRAVSFTSAPIYFLEPNNRILLNDGEYVINTINFPLGNTGTMTVSATKVVQSLQGGG